MWILNPSVQVFLVGPAESPVGFIFSWNDDIYQVDQLDQSDVSDVDALLQGVLSRTTGRIVRTLIDRGMMESLPPEDLAGIQASKLSRQISYLSGFSSLPRAVSAVAKIRGSHAVIVGVGGLGCHIAEHLARIGVSHMTLVDDDIVEDSNLNRQILYTPQAITRKKTVAARERLNEISPYLRVDIFDSIDKLLSSLRNGDLSTDICFVSADRDLISSSLDLTATFWKQRIPYIFSGYSGATIQIRPILRFSNGCGFCMTAATRGPEWCQNIGRDRPHHIASSGYSINAVAAALTVEIWYKRFLLDEQEDKSIKFSMKDYSFRSEKLRKLQSCPICANDSE